MRPCALHGKGLHPRGEVDLGPPAERNLHSSRRGEDVANVSQPEATGDSRRRDGLEATTQSRGHLVNRARSAGRKVDFLAAPLVIVAGSVLVSRVRAPYRAVVQGALIASGIITLTTWPFLRGYGLRSDNASVLPNNYALGLSIVVAVVWLGAAGVLLGAWRRSR